jgi:hypothetical protein
MRAVLITLAVLAVQAMAGEDIVKNGDFKAGAAGWSDLASDADREVAVTEVDGAKVLQLKRIKPGAAALATQYNLKLKPMTLYKISITAKATARRRFHSSPNLLRMKSMPTFAKAGRPVRARCRPQKISSPKRSGTTRA